MDFLLDKFNIKINEFDFKETLENYPTDIDDATYHRHARSCSKFFDLLSKLPINENDKFLDIGCGKGYCLIIAHLFPFSKIDGIEIDNKIANICNDNLKKINLTSDIIQNDILKIDNDKLNQYNYYYIYHSFNYKVFELLLKKLNYNRNITIIYKNIHKEDKDILIKNNFKLINKFNSNPVNTQGDVEISGNCREYYIYKFTLLPNSN